MIYPLCIPPLFCSIHSSRKFGFALNSKSDFNWICLEKQARSDQIRRTQGQNANLNRGHKIQLPQIYTSHVLLQEVKSVRLPSIPIHSLSSTFLMPRFIPTKLKTMFNCVAIESLYANVDISRPNWLYIRYACPLDKPKGFLAFSVISPILANTAPFLRRKPK